MLILLPEQNVQQNIADFVNAAFSKHRESLADYDKAQQFLEAELGLDKPTFLKSVGYNAPV